MVARILIIGAGILLVSACGGAGTAGSGEGGLYGIVRVAPATPVCKIGTSCSRPARDFSIVFVRNRRSVATATTDRHGRYRVKLPRGRYSVRALRRSTLPKSGLRPRIASVPSGRFARADFTFDPGIR